MKTPPTKTDAKATRSGVAGDFERVADIGEAIRKMAEQYRRLAGDLRMLQADAF